MQSAIHAWPPFLVRSREVIARHHAVFVTEILPRDVGSWNMARRPARSNRRASRLSTTRVAWCARVSSVRGTPTCSLPALTRHRDCRIHASSACAAFPRPFAADWSHRSARSRESAPAIAGTPRSSRHRSRQDRTIAKQRNGKPPTRSDALTTHRERGYTLNKCLNNYPCPRIKPKSG